MEVCESDFARQLERENTKLRAALGLIANADYRGNRHPSATIAYEALK